MKKIKALITLLTVFLFFSQAVAQGEFASNLIGVGVVVSDLEKSLMFYTDVIGMEVVDEFNVDEQFARISGLSRGVPFNVKVLKLENSPSANQWKLMSFGQGASHPLPGNIQDDTGMQYITIMVNDLTPFVERIKKNKVKLLGETPTPLGGDNHFVLIQDPDGVFVELIGPMK